MTKEFIRVWLKMKRAELDQSRANHGDTINEWDLPKFIAIIEEQAREIRRLKTDLLRK